MRGARLVYEVVWLQLLELVIGSTGASLGILLGTLMGGLCLGSLLLPRCISPSWHPLRVYAGLEAIIGAFGILVLFAVPIAGRLYAANVATGVPGLLLRGFTCALCLLPPTILLGATLPAIARRIEMTPHGVSKLGFLYGGNILGAVFGCLLAGFYVLRVYDMPTATYLAAAVNGVLALAGWILATVIPYSPRESAVGAIAGALLFSIVLLPVVGTRDSQRIMIAFAAAAGLLALAPLMASPRHRKRRPWRGVLALCGALTLAMALAVGVGPVPPGLIAFGRALPTHSDLPNFLYVGEGMNASVAVSKFPLPSAPRMFHVSGKIEASSEPGDMRLQRLLGHLPALLHREPRSVLVVGFGAGVTAGSFVLYPEVERIVICEIEALVPVKVAPYFKKENYDVISDPRVEVVHDDARHFILTTEETFDLITSDPVHPWVKGAATLYTQEYLTLAREHLNPGGVMAQWVPLYESGIDGVKSLVATFFQVFPDGSLWTHIVRERRGDDVVMIGQPGPTRVGIEALSARFNGPGYARVRASLREIGIGSLIELFSGYRGQKDELAPWLAGAAINRDRNLRLQYLAGMEKYVFGMDEIHAELDRLRKVPESLFLASDAWKEELRRALDPARPLSGHHHSPRGSR